jgi:hypothetical protein
LGAFDVILELPRLRYPPINVRGSFAGDLAHFVLSRQSAAAVVYAGMAYFGVFSRLLNFF